MLARLDDDPAIERGYVSHDGSLLLIEGVRSREGSPDRAALLTIVTAVLAEAQLRPEPEPAPAAQAAWVDRARPERWLGRADAWRLSWIEAERFADRLLAWLDANASTGGPQVALRPVLVELFFGEVEPGLAPGPAPTSWTRDADRPTRIAVVLRAATPHLDAEALTLLGDVLGDEARTRAIIQPDP